MVCVKVAKHSQQISLNYKQITKIVILHLNTKFHQPLNFKILSIKKLCLYNLF